MSWILRKLDTLAAAVCATAGAAAVAQAPAFATAYLQRLGGRLDEARDTLARIQSGEMIPGAEEATRLALVRDQAARVGEVEQIYNALRDAAAVWRPFTLLRHLDGSVAGRTLADFTPSVPLDAAGLIWAGVGVLLAVVLWELAKVPVLLLLPDGDPPPEAPARPRMRKREPHF